ncbi:integrase-like protein [Klugiella xanthotipulae]|uniref:Integrase-like protein n=2 Tax=Klugiella xanthotipulae TaxID=244735 RepID=A0A543HSR8_9MICO|nr:integrase-like protein [Klugiella xanthotipulae]
MQIGGITGIIPRTWRPASTVHGGDSFLVERQFDQGERDLAWFSDITYLRTGGGGAYLRVVRDGHTRRVLGCTVGDSLHTDLVEGALRQSVALRGHLPRKVVFHTDRGTQYTSASLPTPRPSSGRCARWEEPGCAGGIVLVCVQNTSTTTGTFSPPSPTPLRNRLHQPARVRTLPAHAGSLTNHPSGLRGQPHASDVNTKVGGVQPSACTPPTV